jgi:hypothetical protein
MEEGACRTPFRTAPLELDKASGIKSPKQNGTFLRFGEFPVE